MNDHAADGREAEPASESPGESDTADDTAATAQPQASGAPQDELSELREQLEEAREQQLRLAAELDNVRKRTAREVENAHRFGIERFAQALLPVIDSFEAALNAEHPQIESLLEGQRATLRLLEQAFQDAGIASIDPGGEPFDPQQHEAMSMLASPTAEPDSIVDVIQKGYSLHSRLLRPARVIVAKAPESAD